VGITRQGVKDKNGVGFILVELSESFVRQPNMRERVAMFGGEGTDLAERPIS